MGHSKGECHLLFDSYYYTKKGLLEELRHDASTRAPLKPNLPSSPDEQPGLEQVLTQKHQGKSPQDVHLLCSCKDQTQEAHFPPCKMFRERIVLFEPIFTASL